MDEKLKNFFERLINEPDFREIFSSTKTAYEGYTMAMPYIEGVSFEEFKNGLTYIHNKIPYRKKLLSRDLKNVSGGVDIFEEVLSILEQYEGKLF